MAEISRSQILQFFFSSETDEICSFHLHYNEKSILERKKLLVCRLPLKKRTLHYGSFLNQKSLGLSSQDLTLMRFKKELLNISISLIFKKFQCGSKYIFQENHEKIFSGDSNFLRDILYLPKAFRKLFLLFYCRSSKDPPFR